MPKWTWPNMERASGRCIECPAPWIERHTGEQRAARGRRGNGEKIPRQCPSCQVKTNHPSARLSLASIRRSRIELSTMDQRGSPEVLECLLGFAYHPLPDLL